MRTVILIAALALPLSASFALTQKSEPPPQFKVLKAEFGVISPGGFQPSTKVPLKEGQRFGWVIQLETKRERIKWREEFRVPAVPQIWQVDDKSTKHTLSTDRKTSVLEGEARLENGLIYNFWQIAPGDPKGRHQMRVMVEGLLVATFDFDVE